jgi:glycosyltransferase involved in cell wall biosynthesis
VPTVSIIIPVFNRFTYTDRALQSVINQTYPDWELFVVDDCSDSPYSLPDFCEGYRDRITLLHNEKNMGPGLSRQRGVDLSKGEYVCFLDSDDYYDSLFLAKSLEAHGRLPEVAGTYTIAKYIQTDTIRAGSDINHRYIVPNLFDFFRPWPTCAWMWKKQFISRWKDLKTNQDSLFEIDISMVNNRIAHIPEVLCYIDKDTGANITNLVSKVQADLHKNKVALYAFESRKLIRIEASESHNLNRAIIKRLVYVSAKLAGHGYGKLIFQNGKQILWNSPFIGVVLILCSLPIFLKIRSLKMYTKIFLERVYSRM